MSEVAQLPWAALPQDPLTLLTGTCRLSWPNLAQPRAFEGNKPKYSATLIFPKSAQIDALKAVIVRARDEKWGSRLPANLRYPLRDGAEKLKEDGTAQNGYGPDVFFLNTNSERKPQLLDNMNQPFIDDASVERALYGGCYVRALLRAYCYDVSGNRGVALGLNAIQFIGHGVPLGSSVDATSVMTAVPIDGLGQAAGMPTPGANGAAAPGQSMVDAMFGG